MLRCFRVTSGLELGPDRARRPAGPPRHRLLAYVLGLRHAVDADHIATIDNVVRKLMQEGKRPHAVGLFFSLGHSLSIVVLVAAIAGAAFALQGRFAEFKSIGAVIGTGASAFFLLAIAVINLVILRGVWRSFRKARRGEPVEEQEFDCASRRPRPACPKFRPLFRMVSRSWQMFQWGFVRAWLRHRDRDQLVRCCGKPGLSAA